MYINIQTLSMNLSQANIMNQVSSSVMNNVLDTFEIACEGIIKMIEQLPSMEQSVNPNLGQNIDIRL